MMRELIASIRGDCHEQNVSTMGSKRPAVVSYNQEREHKKNRQFVANHGIR